MKWDENRRMTVTRARATSGGYYTRATKHKTRSELFLKKHCHRKIKSLHSLEHFINS